MEMFQRRYNLLSCYVLAHSPIALWLRARKHEACVWKWTRKDGKRGSKYGRELTSWIICGRLSRLFLYQCELEKPTLLALATHQCENSSSCLIRPTQLKYQYRSSLTLAKGALRWGIIWKDYVLRWEKGESSIYSFQPTENSGDFDYLLANKTFFLVLPSLLVSNSCLQMDLEDQTEVSSVYRPVYSLYSRQLVGLPFHY